MSDITLNGVLGLLRNYAKAKAASNEAESITGKLPGWATNGYGDAARHAIASGLIARRVNPETAMSAGALHELLMPNDSERETSMDNRNNRFGVEMALYFPTDQAYIDYILGTPGQGKSQDIGEALTWFGKPKSSEVVRRAQGGLVQYKECNCRK